MSDVINMTRAEFLAMCEEAGITFEKATDFLKENASKGVSFDDSIRMIKRGMLSPLHAMDNETPTRETREPSNEEKLISAVVSELRTELQASCDTAAAKTFDEVKAEIDLKLEAEVARLKPLLLPSSTTVNLTVEGKDYGKVTDKHPIYETVLRLVGAGIPVYLVGPAGVGKTTMAHHVATHLKLDFHTISVCNQTPEFKLLGARNAMGEFIMTELLRCWKDGGLFLLDEIDAGNANVIAAMNAILSNTHVSIDGKLVERHPDFRVIAAANTVGQGASRMYVGRNQLDAATLDRFYFVEMMYDESWERKTFGNTEWCRLVQALRKVAGDRALRLVFSPRAIIQGHAAIEAGLPEKELWHGRLEQGMGVDARVNLITALREDASYESVFEKYLVGAAV